MKAVNILSTLTLLFALIYGAMQIAHDIGYKYAQKTWVNPRGATHG